MKVPSQRPGRFALITLALLVGSVGCQGGGSPRVPIGPQPAPAQPPTAEFSDLHDQSRLPGLEDRRFDQDSYWRVVEPVVTGSDLFRVNVVGESAEGRLLRTISFGEGPASVFLWSQMHGDESTASMALADLYALVAQQPNHPVIQAILEGATVHTLPMLNPDGAQRFQRRNAQGIDINRDARALSTPEGRTLKAVRDLIDPDFGFNLHDQGIGTRVGSSDRGAAIALLSPPFDASREVNDVRQRAMEVMGVMIRAMEPMVGGHISAYGDTFNPRAFGDLITQWGTSTILIESGGWAQDPQKQYLRKVNFVALLAALESIARGSYHGVPMDLYLNLPSNGRRVADLLIVGGTLVVPGLQPYKTDLLVNYTRPLLEEGGTFAEVGDLAETEALDTLSLDGLFVHPAESALDRWNGIQIRVGADAVFTVTRNQDGSDPVWTFDGGPPANLRKRR